jgi:enoyl-CoA hydratase/carnithine racemase
MHTEKLVVQKRSKLRYKCENGIFRKFTVARDGARVIKSYEPNIATPPLAGGVQRIAARAGRARAFEVTTSGHFYEAEQFERWNIINRVLPFDTLQAEAEAFAAKSDGPKSNLRFASEGVP